MADDWAGGFIKSLADVSFIDVWSRVMNIMLSDVLVDVIIGVVSSEIAVDESADANAIFLVVVVTGLRVFVTALG